MLLRNTLKSYINPLSLLLKILMRHPYLKIHDLANLLVADAPMKKKKKKSRKFHPPLGAL